MRMSQPDKIVRSDERVWRPKAKRRGAGVNSLPRAPPTTMSKKGARSDEIDVFAPRIEPINGAATPNSPLISAPGKDSNLSEYQRLYGAVAHGGEEIRVPNGESLYTALDRRGLLEHASAPSNIGMNLVQEGEIGLAMFNGRPRFLAPGRHTLWSPLSSVIDIVPITQVRRALSRA